MQALACFGNRLGMVNSMVQESARAAPPTRIMRCVGGVASNHCSTCRKIEIVRTRIGVVPGARFQALEDIRRTSDCLKAFSAMVVDG